MKAVVTHTLTRSLNVWRCSCTQLYDTCVRDRGGSASTPRRRTSHSIQYDADVGEGGADRTGFGNDHERDTWVRCIVSSRLWTTRPGVGYTSPLFLAPVGSRRSEDV